MTKAQRERFAALGEGVSSGRPLDAVELHYFEVLALDRIANALEALLTIGLEARAATDLEKRAAIAQEKERLSRFPRTDEQPSEATR